MRPRPRLTLALVALAVAVVAPLRPEAAEARSCAWEAKVDPAGLNVLYPDEAAHYWTTSLAVPPGAVLVVHGRFPHSRYVSFTSYDPALRSADGLADVAIDADPGSSNPFLPGADRRTDRRGYTVEVVPGNRPVRPARNTLYTGSQDGSRSNKEITVVYRNYRPDRGLGDDGGVGLPSVTIRTPGGDVPVPTCPQPTVPPNGVNATVAAASPVAPYPPFLGTDPVVWRKFYNLPTSAAYAVSNPFSGSAVGDGLSPVTTSTAPGGFADNPDNKYVSTLVSSGLGQVVLIQARMPLFPGTYDGQARMTTGQLRYWSMCSEEFATGRYYACLVDDEVPLGPGRTFTIMVSTTADRPRNASAACGIAWLPMGPAADTVLLERNMLASPGFRNSVQAARFGHEQQDLGAYYPRTRYVTTAQAQALGCHGKDAR